MRSIKEGYLLSGAAAMLIAAWVEPIPSTDPQSAARPKEGKGIIKTELWPTLPAESLAIGSVRADSASGEPSSVVATPILSRWVGLNERKLVAALGPPTMKEERPPARLTSFRRGSCTLTVTLNPDVETRDFHALDYEVISDANTARRNRECAVEFSGRLPQE
jgi:hypothetical protein